MRLFILAFALILMFPGFAKANEIFVTEYVVSQPVVYANQTCRRVRTRAKSTLRAIGDRRRARKRAKWCK